MSRSRRRGTRSAAPARTTRSAQRRPSPGRQRSLYSIAPPVLGLVVSSPAIVGGLTGTTDPVHAFGIVSVSLSAAWMLSALGARVAAAVPARAVPDLDRRADEADPHDSHGATALGRIEPVQVPASEAIPGTPPPTSDMEGPLP